jgi:hypothetical protein
LEGLKVQKKKTAKKTKETDNSDARVTNLSLLSVGTQIDQTVWKIT